MAAVWIYLLPLAMSVLTSAQEEKILSYSIYEETPSNTFISDIRKDARLQEEFGDVFSELRYAILPQSSEYSSYFTIDEMEGVLRTAAKIDRDEMCKVKVSCPIRLDLTIQPREYFQIIKVTVIIEDTNDNPPQFVPGRFSRSVAENTQPGASLTIPTADDPDSPKFGVKRYELVTGAPHFALKVTNSSDGTIDLHLVLQETLDRETRELYRVVVAAYDGGIPPNSGFLTIDVIVTDINDNNPKFDNQTYQVTVPENVSKDVIIIRVRAKDADAGPNGQVVYTFASKTLAAFGHLFSLNNSTGEITVKSSLDYEENTMYNLAVTARDRNPESLAALAKVIVKVQDVNDHSPEITINALTSTGHVEISEGAPIDSFVAHLSVADPDSGRNGQFTCSLASSYFNIQQMYQTEYKVVTTKTLDRETANNYDLAFVCEDHGTPALTSTTRISVTILDENDSAPQFSKQSYSTIMAENNKDGAFIVQVNATDADQGQNGMVEYRPFGSALGVLNVNPISGNVTARVSFDYEKADKFEFLIIATDHGVPPNTATATVILKLTDVDDELPVFSEPEYMFDVYENLPLGTQVGQVSATDLDSAPFNEFIFKVVPDALTTQAFVLESQTGKIFTRRELDREEQSQYQLVVMAISKGAPSMSTSVLVVIHIADKNDNSPVVLFPNLRNNTVHISSHTPVGEKVTEIKAVDADIGINSQLTYTFIGNSQRDFFTINEESGMILVKSNLEALNDELFKMQVKVHDNGHPQHTVETVLNIVVNKSLDHPMMSNQNLNIVVSVAVLSAVLTIILTVAIVITKRLDRRQNKSQYLYNTSSEQVIVGNHGNTDPANTKVPARTKDDVRNTKEVAFNNQFDLEDEQHPKYPVSEKSKDTQLTKQPKPNNWTRSPPRPGGKVPCYPSVHQLAMNHRGPGRPQSGDQDGPLRTTTPDDLQMQKAVVKEGDSDSTNSAPVSITDSGRGSNEDTNESRPSVDSDHQLQPTDGLDLRVAPLPRPQQGNAECFKARLSGVVQRQGEEAQQKMSRQRLSDQQPKMAPAGRHSTQRGRALMSKTTDRTSEASNTAAAWHSRCPTQRSQPGDCGTSAQTSNSHGEHRIGQDRHLGHSSKPSHHGNHSQDRFQDNSVQDSSWVEDDESETDWSDEDKEYVYYVNASHV